MSWSLAAIPDLSGKTAVVTGANGGLGFESVKALAGAGAHVIMAARSHRKAKAARDEILDAHPGASLEIVELDLGSVDSAKAASSAIADKRPTVDILINNAGLMAMPERRTSDGFEEQLGVNHLGHWVFTAGLLRPLLAADSARVVTVTSTARHFGRTIDTGNVHMDGNYSPWGAYGRSKLANFHFTLGLQHEFEKRALSAQSLVAHPGLSNTNLQTHAVAQGASGWMGTFSHRLVSRIGMTPAGGALPQLRAATDPGARGGELYAPRFVNTGAPVRRPIMRPGSEKAIDKLWLVSERETGVALDFDAALKRL